MDIVNEKWPEIIEHLRIEHELSNVSFNTWIQPLKVYEVIDNTVFILVNMNASVEYIEKKYLLPLKVCISEITGTDYEVVFISEDDSRINEIRSMSVEATHKKRTRTASEKAGLNPKYTFDTFVVGGNNNFAHAASLAVAESPGEVYNPLFLYGDVGLGKTHLMHSIAHFILNKNSKKKVLYVTSETFTNELIEALKNGKTANNESAMAQFRDKYRNNDILLIDDIQFIQGKESTVEEFFHTFNTLYESNKQIVLASDRPPKEIKTLEDRLRTRFEWGLLADIQTPDFETRIAIIRRKAQLMDISVPDDVSEYIANRLKTNIRQLEGAVKKLKAYKLLQGTSPSIVIAQNAIRDILNDSQPVPVTVERIIAEVGRTYGISPQDIRSTKRNAQISSARQISMYIVREITQMSMSTIGEEFGNRDHSTVVYATKQVEKRMERDSHYRETVEDIIKNIKATS